MTLCWAWRLRISTAEHRPSAEHAAPSPGATSPCRSGCGCPLRHGLGEFAQRGGARALGGVDKHQRPRRVVARLAHPHRASPAGELGVAGPQSRVAEDDTARLGSGERRPGAFGDQTPLKLGDGGERGNEEAPGRAGRYLGQIAEHDPAFATAIDHTEQEPRVARQPVQLRDDQRGTAGTAERARASSGRSVRLPLSTSVKLAASLPPGRPARYRATAACWASGRAPIVPAWRWKRGNTRQSARRRRAWRFSVPNCWLDGTASPTVRVGKLKWVGGMYPLNRRA